MSNVTRSIYSLAVGRIAAQEAKLQEQEKINMRLLRELQALKTRGAANDTGTTQEDTAGPDAGVAGVSLNSQSHIVADPSCVNKLR